MDTFETEEDSEMPLCLRFLNESRFILNTFLMRHKPRALGLTLDFHLLSWTLWGMPGFQAMSDVN